MPDDRLTSADAEKKLPQPEVYIVRNGEAVFKPGMKTWFVETREDESSTGIFRPEAESVASSVFVKSTLPAVNSDSSLGLFTPARWKTKSASAANAARCSGELLPMSHSRISHPPRARRAAHRFLPANPADPVTRNFFMRLRACQMLFAVPTRTVLRLFRTLEIMS